jgi:type III secretory pathway component EscV|tara:strand:+ start:497 stop:706 length:210 start_codon:yes stop_codon:yes gene_type:complete
MRRRRKEVRENVSTIHTQLDYHISVERAEGIKSIHLTSHIACMRRTMVEEGEVNLPNIAAGRRKHFGQP